MALKLCNSLIGLKNTLKILDSFSQIVEFCSRLDIHMIFLCALLSILFRCLYLFSGAESAFSALSSSDEESLKGDNRRSSASILKLLSAEDSLPSTIHTLIGVITLSIILISSFVIDEFVPLSESTFWVLALKFAIIVFVLLIFGGVIPRSVALHNPLKFSRVVATPLMVFMQALRPLLYIIVCVEGRIGRNIATKKVSISIDELSNVIKMTENQTSEEKMILSGIVKFVNTEVGQVMKPRFDVIGLDVSCNFGDVKSLIIESGFSRIPVYEGSLDSIIGLLYVKDMLPYISQGVHFEWRQFLRKAYFVPEHKKIDDLLKEFQSNKVHIAVVVDEYGSTLGLVSLEDILEEVVGEILDESDIEEATFYKVIDESNYFFDGKTHLQEFREVLGVESDFFIDVEDSAETVAGLMLETNQDFLYVGDSVEYRNITLTVDVMDGRRIDRVKVHIVR